MNESYYSEELLKYTKTFIETVTEAKNEAIKNGIKANTIVVRPGLAKVNGFDLNVPSTFDGHCIEHMPPMILGMEAYIADPKDIPPDVGFIVTHKDYTAVDRIRRQAQDELIEKLKEKSFREVCDILYGEEYDY